MPCHTGRAGFTDDFSELTSPVWACGRNLGGLLTRVCRHHVYPRFLRKWGIARALHRWLCTPTSGTSLCCSSSLSNDYLKLVSKLFVSMPLCQTFIHISLLSCQILFFFFPMVGCSSFLFHSIFILNFVLKSVEMVCFKVTWIVLSLCSRFTFILHVFGDICKQNEPRG